MPMSVKKLVGPMIVRVLSLVLMLDGIQASAQADSKRAAEAEAKMAAGEELSERGQFEEAVGRWREAERAFAGAKDADGEIRALLRQAAACQSLGQHRLKAVGQYKAIRGKSIRLRLVGKRTLNDVVILGRGRVVQRCGLRPDIKSHSPTELIDQLVGTFVLVVDAMDLTARRVLGDYGRRWPLLVRTIVPVDQVVSLKLLEKRPWLNAPSATMTLVVPFAEARSTHIEIRAGDEGIVLAIAC